MSIFLHAGLPRTATTVLQGQVFPKLTKIHFVGKNPDNQPLDGKLNPIVLVRECCDRYKAGDPTGMDTLRRALPTVLMAVKLSNRDGKKSQALHLARIWAACLRETAESLADKPILFSDESLTESISGLAAHVEHGDEIALEQLHAIGFLDRVTLSVVLRDPGQFLKASYYKAMEFEHSYRRAPFSFDDYVRRQLVIYERHPSASRIFLACQRKAAAHFRRLVPHAVVITYENLAKSAHVIDALLGTTTGEVPVSLAAIRRENSSWRKADTNAFILNAPGVPHGISIDAYASTFSATLERFGLDKVFAEELLSDQN